MAKVQTLAPTLQAQNVSDISTQINDSIYDDGQQVSEVFGGGVWQLFKASIAPLSPIVVPTLSGVGRWILTAQPIQASAVEFIFDDGAAQTGFVYGDWAQMCAVIGALPLGALPSVKFVKSFTVPTVGMPPGGWGPFGLGTWLAFDVETGTVVVTIPDTVKIDSLSQIDNGLVVTCFPDTSDGVFVYSQLLPGQQWVMRVELAAALSNQSPSNKALLVTPGIPGTPTTIALAFDNANNLIVPSIAPFVRLMGDDSAIGALISNRIFSGFPDGWVVGGGAGSGIVYLNGVDAGPLPLIPGFTGGGGVAIINNSSARNVTYTPANAGDWGGNPATSQDALDRIAAAVAGLLGGPIP